MFRCSTCTRCPAHRPLPLQLHPLPHPFLYFQMLNLDEMHLDIHTESPSPNVTYAIGHRIAKASASHARRPTADHPAPPPTHFHTRARGIPRAGERRPNAM